MTGRADIVNSGGHANFPSRPFGFSHYAKTLLYLQRDPRLGGAEGPLEVFAYFQQVALSSYILSGQLRSSSCRFHSAESILTGLIAATPPGKVNKNATRVALKAARLIFSTSVSLHEGRLM